MICERVNESGRAPSTAGASDTKHGCRREQQAFIVGAQEVSRQTPASPGGAYTIILPFVKPNEPIPCLNSLSKCKEISQFNILLIHNSAAQPPEAYQSLRDRFPNLKMSVLSFDGSYGAAQAWCFGISAARTDWVCLVASDSAVAPAWASSIIRSVVPDKQIYIGDYSQTKQSGVWPEVERRIDERRFAEFGRIDFRCAVLNRGFISDIIQRYFHGKYCSDSELDILVYDRLKEPVVKIPGMAVYNHYPTSTWQALKRKFRHGMGCGRIERESGCNISGEGKLLALLRQFLPNRAAASTDIGMGVLTKVASSCAKFTYNLGMLLGYLAPARVVHLVQYKFYFDDKCERLFE